jgi:DNA-binding MarR family transcriptional regulator
MPRRPSSATTARSGALPASREAWSLIIQFFKAAKMRSFAEFDLTPAQAQLLIQLDPLRPIAMSELANMLGCDASNVTGLVDRLEERGMIERRAAAADRRVKKIAITPPGAKQRNRILDRWHEPPPQIAALPQKDIRELLRILRKAAGD